MADDLELGNGRRVLVLTTLRGDLSNRAQRELETTGLEVIGRIRFDEEIAELNSAGRPITNLSAGSTAWTDVSKLLDRLLQKEDAA